MTKNKEIINSEHAMAHGLTDYVFPMEMHEILDRFVLLYPDQDYYQTLRRVIVDQDISSIFKLYNTELTRAGDFQRATLSEDLRSILRLYKSRADADLIKAIADEDFTAILNLLETTEMRGTKEDFRKALIENNIHALFSLIPKDEHGISELRKAVVEKNIWSIFRILPEHEEYRKSILLKDVRSIFRVLGYETDLRKATLNNNYWALFRLLDKHDRFKYSTRLKALMQKEYTFDTDFFSRGQIRSKMWLVEQINKNFKSLGTVYLCAGWYGTIASMLFESPTSVRDIVSIDQDPTCQKIATTINSDFNLDNKFHHIIGDIHNTNFDKVPHVLNYNLEDEVVKVKRPDTIINTSCEHIKNFAEWYNKIPAGRTVILQSNDYVDIQEHINCVQSNEEFADMAPMDNVVFEGSLRLDGYTRFMRIGVK